MKESSVSASDLETKDFMNRFMEDHKPPTEAIEHFASVKWTADYLNDLAYKAVPTFSRHLKSSGEDYFFSRTINTPQTVPHMVTLQLRDFQTPPNTKGQATSQQRPREPRDHRAVTVVPEKPDVVILLQLGKEGVDGHPGILHGGVCCAILDESMGLLAMLHHNNIVTPGPRDHLFTVNLNINYRAPVPTPSQVIVRTWLTRREGRKWFSTGQIVDSDGRVLTEADAVWAMTSGKL